MKLQNINRFQPNIIVLTLILGWAVQAQYSKHTSGLRAEQNQWLASQQTIWSQQDEVAALAAQEEVQDQEKALAGEMVKALGGPLAAATKDPALDIPQMLEQIANASAPADTQVAVTVDRFTEFDVALVLQGPLTFTRLAEISKSILNNGLPYIHKLRFIQGNELLAGLNEAAIESVANWKNIPVESVKGLLLAGGTEGEPAASAVPDTGGDTAPPTAEELTPDQIKIKDAQTAFQKHYSEHVDRLNQLVVDLNRAARLDEVEAHDQLQSKITLLDQVAARLSVERDFFMNQSADQESLLKDQGLDPLLITILLRDFNQRNELQAPLLTNVLDAVSGFQEQIQNLLTNMDSHWGEWQGKPYTRRIEFMTTAARDAYKKEEDLIQERVLTLDDAFRSLNDHQPAK